MATGGTGRERMGPEGDSGEDSDNKNTVTTSVKTETTTQEVTVTEHVEDEEFRYEPPKFENSLPDLYRLLETMEKEDGDLSNKKQPPSLFSRPEHVDKYQKITKLKLEMEESEMSPYLDHFEAGVRDDVLMIGNVSLEDVQTEERQLRDEHIQYLEQEASEARSRHQELLRREEDAKKRVAKYTQDRREDLQRREEMLRQREKLLMERLHQSFRRAESQLISVLERRKGEVKTFFGDLMMTEVQYGGTRGRRWKVDWNLTPQPVQVKLKCLRGVKDKLPRGRYVMMVSLYDRLGGNILRWSEMKGQHWGAATAPVHHEGGFHNVELKFDQCMFTVLPSKASLKPGMVVVFELYLLRGSVVSTDKVVAWGCAPICDAQFEVIEGKYRVPFLRGEMDPQIEKHEIIEQLISGELDHWLCNLYLEIVKLPRYLAGMKEYEVELEFSSAMTAYPDRRRTGGEEYRDGEAPILGSQSDISSDMGSRSSLQSSELPGYNMPTTRTTATVSKIKLESLGIKESDKATMYGSRKLHKDKKLDLLLMEDSDPEDSEPEDVKAMKSEDEFRKVKHMPGMYYKKYEKNPVDAYHDKLYTVLPKTSITEPNYTVKKLTHLEELEKHTMSVQDPLAGMGRPQRKAYEKMEYVARQFMSELGISQWRGREFWGMMFMLTVVFFLRIFVHYMGQWFYLSAINIPINMYNFLPYTVELNYQPTLLTSQQEIAIVILGPMFNLLVFILLIALCGAFQKLLGQFPDFGCKFVIAYGIMTVLDPILILAMDCILKRYEDDSATPTADFVKLWYHFYRVEGSGLGGVFVTAFLYLGFMFVAGAFLYMYFLRLHNNGRLLDIYWRLRGKEENFFVPYDLELSNQELHYIVNRAEAWRGEEGERRKVAVFDYIWEEEDMEESVWNECTLEEDEQRRKETHKEITTHVAIHTVHLDGLRQLYRQFLRLPDGAVVEVFGDMAVPGMDKDIKDAMTKGTQGIEKLFGSQTSLRERKVHGRETVNTRSGFRDDERPTSSASSSGSSLPKKKMW
ncbi:uncharacterized protein LOC123539694 isoform X3 [Mercenaria mercenaria]|uniref:uncharacterized protein LOC123539694 isoform X3 n=1 Tax=Mercenaria mercenaria TaxID=6596 RepID=UPI00234ED2DC|nr:uncharacterized protein LOC123539694 isoform X3 [Mercenaria mercenaria]